MYIYDTTMTQHYVLAIIPLTACITLSISSSRYFFVILVLYVITEAENFGIGSFIFTNIGVFYKNK